MTELPSSSSAAPPCAWDLGPCGRELDLASSDAGEFLAVLGPNGTGKTTLLKVCSGSFRCPQARCT